MRAKRTAGITASIALLGAMAFLFREPLMFAIGDYLVIHDELKPADVIHVIAGPDDRTDYAIQLYKQGYGKQLFSREVGAPSMVTITDNMAPNARRRKA